jgi:hypothetical protein
MNLQPGDVLWFEEHSALGFLIEKLGDDHWSYALRSPNPEKTEIIVSIREYPEHRMIERIKDGSLALYRNGELEPCLI